MFTAGLAACHDHEHGADDTDQDCFNEHTMEQSLPVQQAIVICCLDHPIGDMGNPVCGDAAASCESYLGTSLTPGSAFTAACAGYVVPKSM